MKNIPLFLFSLFCCVPAKAWSQEKPPPTPKDYQKWHTLSGESISPDGRWASYTLHYESAIDTAFVQKVATGERLVFPAANEVSFSPDSRLAVVQAQNGAVILHKFNSGISDIIVGASGLAFSKAGNLLAVMQDSAGTRQLLVYSNGNLVKRLAGAKDFRMSAHGDIAVIDKSGINLYLASKGFAGRRVLSDSVAAFRKMVWSGSGNWLAFLRQKKSESVVESRQKNEVVLYNAERGMLSILGDERLDGLQITDALETPIILSGDDSMVFFYVVGPSVGVPDDSLVEVWQSSSRLVYPAAKQYGDPALVPRMAVWLPALNEVNILASADFPLSFLTADRQHVLTYSYLTYEPQYAMIAPVDFYIANTLTKACRLMLEKQYFDISSVGGSPSGDYVHYFRDGDWWVYDIAAARHVNLTSGLGVSFEDADFDYPGSPEGYKCPGWTADGKFIVLYDQYDVWLVSPAGNIRRRITRGREHKITYRVCDDIYMDQVSPGSADFLRLKLETPGKGLVLSATGADKSSGYFKWNPDGSIDKIVYGNQKYSGLKIAECGNGYLFTGQTFERPPALYYCRAKHGRRPKLLFQSNPHFAKYACGTSKLLSYKGPEGRALQAALYLPANFDKTKQYPMVVYIYSRLSQDIHEYRNPAMYDVIGFPVADYISDGYVVLMPDIRYDVGSPGESAFDCVSAAVVNALAQGFVDKKRIGIIGHSYGGYETCHLLTRTPMFAAAVAGAAVTDMVSAYFSMNTDHARKVDWRFESQQYRMGSTPLENLEGYLENSTAVHAGQITTPLLLWSGKNDPQVDWRQGIELHLALRRLGKENVFLAYPGQGHILTDPGAQYDLTVRTRSWFDHYLKGMPFPAGE